MLTLIIVAAVAWFAFAHFKKKKHEAEARNVDYQNDLKSSKRLRWKDRP